MACMRRISAAGRPPESAGSRGERRRRAASTTSLPPAAAATADATRQLMEPRRTAAAAALPSRPVLSPAGRLREGRRRRHGPGSRHAGHQSRRTLSTMADHALGSTLICTSAGKSTSHGHSGSASAGRRRPSAAARPAPATRPRSCSTIQSTSAWPPSKPTQAGRHCLPAAARAAGQLAVGRPASNRSPPGSVLRADQGGQQASAIEVGTSQPARAEVSRQRPDHERHLGERRPACPASRPCRRRML